MDDSREDLEQALLPGEQLLWSGRPDPKVIFGPVDALLIPFGLVFAGFAGAWMLIAISIGHNPEFALFGVPFLLFGFYYLFGRFFVKVARKKRTSYGITDRRALVVTNRVLTECPISGQQRTIRKALNGGHLTVTFGRFSVFDYWGNRSQVPNAGLDFLNLTGARPVGFYDVADVEGLTSALVVADLTRP